MISILIHRIIPNHHSIMPPANQPERPEKKKTMPTTAGGPDLGVPGPESHATARRPRVLHSPVRLRRDLRRGAELLRGRRDRRPEEGAPRRRRRLVGGRVQRPVRPVPLARRRALRPGWRAAHTRGTSIGHNNNLSD